LARTKDENFFLPPNPLKKKNKWISRIPKDIEPVVLEEIKTHRHIRIKMWENILLYISDTRLGFLLP
jgi:hypothetical protein